jgi:magnesium transporter
MASWRIFMVNCFFLENNVVKMESGNHQSSISNIIWVDLINPTRDEKQQVEKDFSVELFTKHEREEIESSSKYVETTEEIGINLNFLIQDGDNFTNEPVSFIIKDKVLITQRYHEYRSFSETYRKLTVIKPIDGDDVFLTILETRIDFDADLIESITDRISAISKEMTAAQDTNRELLLKITALQESTIAIRENIIEKQRILSSMLKSKMFPKEDYANMRIMIKDVGSLLDHTSFNFERLEFLQNTFLGLVDIEQNRVIKIFTVVTVIFMPPTVIASAYGMNFKFMPELEKVWGYPFALVLMLLSSVMTLLFFKRKKWL